MYSVWRCVRARSNASSSAAHYVLTVWFQLQPSTGCIRCEITTNIKHVLPAHPRDIDLQWCLVELVEDTACPEESSYLPSKSSACLANRWFSQPHHCFLQWLASVFPTSSLPPAVVREQSVCGWPPGQPHPCSASSEKCSLFVDRPKSDRLRFPRTHYIQERFLLRFRPLAASAVLAFLALPPRAVAITTRVLEIFGWVVLSL